MTIQSECRPQRCSRRWVVGGLDEFSTASIQAGCGEDQAGQQLGVPLTLQLGQGADHVDALQTAGPAHAHQALLAGVPQL
jgi:hypothetical protein